MPVPFFWIYAMKKFVLLLGIFFFAAVLLMAQQPDSRSRDLLDKSYQEYRDFFEKQIEKGAVDSIQEKLLFNTLHPERLPAWMFEKHTAKHDSIYVISVSDPGMDAAKGMELAKYRALIMYALCGEMNVSNIREQYLQEAGDSQYNIYNEFSSFEGRLNVLLYEIVVIQSHVTQYDETIILAAMPRKKSLTPLVNKPYWHFNAGLFTRVTRSGNRIQLDEQLQTELRPSQYMSGSHYSHHYTKINRIVNSHTHLNNETVTDLPALNLRYALPLNFEPDENLVMKEHFGFGLRNGLWHAMLTAILSKINDEAHRGSIQFRQVGDVYDRIMQFMSNELVSTTVQSSLPVFHVVDNELFLLHF